MTINSALHGAQGAVLLASQRAAVIADNIVGVETEGYRRRALEASVGPNGVILASLNRLTDQALSQEILGANARYVSAKVMQEYIDDLRALKGGNGSEAPMVEAVGDIMSSLAALINDPSDIGLSQNLISNVERMVGLLNAQSRALNELAERVDQDVGKTVQTARELTSSIEAIDREIVASKKGSSRILALYDQRAQLVSSLSEIISISTIPARNGGIAIYAGANVPLYDREARQIEVISLPSEFSGSHELRLKVDNVEIDRMGKHFETPEGRLPALLSLRNEILPRQLELLDAVAFALVDVFVDEPIGNKVVGRRVPGLVQGELAQASHGDMNRGIGNTLTLSPHTRNLSFVATLLRDGGVSDPDDHSLNHNPEGYSGFNVRFSQYLDSMRGQRQFRFGNEMSEKMSLEEFVIMSLAKVDEYSRLASLNLSDRSMRYDYLQHQSQSGFTVDLDQELTRLIKVEQSYQASVKLLTTLNTMFEELLRAA